MRCKSQLRHSLSLEKQAKFPQVRGLLIVIIYEKRFTILIITICFQREMGALTSIPLCQRARGAEEGGDTNNNLQEEEDRNITQVTKIKVVIIWIKDTSYTSPISIVTPILSGGGGSTRSNVDAKSASTDRAAARGSRPWRLLQLRLLGK